MPKRRSVPASPASFPAENLLEDSPNEDECSEGSSSQPPVSKKALIECEIKNDNEQFMSDVKHDMGEFLQDGSSSNSPDNEIRTSQVPEDDEEMEYGEEDEEDSDVEGDADKAQIPAIEEGFATCCSQLDLSQEIATGAWAVYNRAKQRLILEGDQKGWQLAALYYYFLSKYVKGRKGMNQMQSLPAAVNDMLAVFGVSAVEFFDKVLRFLEATPSNKIRRYSDYVKSIQEGLAVTTVIFKKFVKIYRLMFKFVSSQQPFSTPIPTTLDTFSIIWTMFLVMKRSLPTEDLLTCFHLLICIFDMVYTDMCNRDEKMDAHFNPEFVEFLLTTDMTIVRALCDKFDGVVLDARHFMDHMFFKVLKYDLPEELSIRENCPAVLEHLNNVYTKWILMRGQVDERIFIPTEEELEYVFSEQFYDDKMTEILRRGADSVLYSEADFLAKLSNQNCLDKVALIADSKEGIISQMKDSYRVPFVGNPLDGHSDGKESPDSKIKLKRILGNWELETSNLKKYCDKMADNPTATLLLKRDVMCDKFSERINLEMVDNPNYDQAFFAELDQNKKMLEKLFMLYLEKIVICEVEKKCREEDLLNVLRRDEFLDSAFCFCTELVLFSCGSVRVFPWSSELCDVHPFLFHKVIDLMINHEKSLSRAMVQHFNGVEEHIIEELAWKRDSPLWHIILKYPLKSFSEFGEDWFEKGQSPLKFSSMKKKPTLTDDLGRPILPSSGHSRTIRVFLKRTYFTAAIRLHDLCDRVGMSQRAKSQVWSIFDYVLRSETAQLMDRNLDQMLMCCVYVVAKINRMGTTFMEIMAHYKRQPQAKKSIYREVTIDADYLKEETSSIARSHEDINSKLEGFPKETVTVDIIKYYNLVFRDRVKMIVHNIEIASDEDLNAMPVPTCYGLAPVKVNLTRTVAIQTLPKTLHGSSKQELVIANMAKSGLYYDVMQSPRKELEIINSRLAAQT